MGLVVGAFEGRGVDEVGLNVGDVHSPLHDHTLLASSIVHVPDELPPTLLKSQFITVLAQSLPKSHEISNSLGIPNMV